MEPLLETRDLKKSFGGVNAVDGLDFHVGEGEILGVIGPNGSGKTTLFNLVTGFLKPTAGRILFRGADITGARPHLIARRGVVRTFQLNCCSAASRCATTSPMHFSSSSGPVRSAPSFVPGGFGTRNRTSSKGRTRCSITSE